MHLLVPCVGSRRKYSSTDTRIFDLQVPVFRLASPLTRHSKLLRSVKQSSFSDCFPPDDYMYLVFRYIPSFAYIHRGYFHFDLSITGSYRHFSIPVYQYTSTSVHIVHSSHSPSRHHPLASGPGQPQLGEHEHNLEAESPHIINTAPAPLASCRIENDAQCNSWSRSVDSSSASDGTVACHTRLLIQH